MTTSQVSNIYACTFESSELHEIGSKRFDSQDEKTDVIDVKHERVLVFNGGKVVASKRTQVKRNADRCE